MWSLIVERNWSGVDKYNTERLVTMDRTSGLGLLSHWMGVVRYYAQSTFGSQGGRKVALATCFGDMGRKALLVDDYIVEAADKGPEPDPFAQSRARLRGIYDMPWEQDHYRAVENWWDILPYDDFVIPHLRRLLFGYVPTGTLNEHSDEAELSKDWCSRHWFLLQIRCYVGVCSGYSL